MSQRINNGDIVQHFKRGSKPASDLAYCYVVLDDNVIHTETKERHVVYQALYGDNNKYCRPYDMFMSGVDREKYPDVKQKYRLELITDSELLSNCKEFLKTLR